MAVKKSRKTTSEEKEVETGGIEVEEYINEKVVTSTQTESERVEKRKNPFACVWDWSKALWRGDEMEVKKKWARFGDG